MKRTTSILAALYVSVFLVPKANATASYEIIDLSEMYYPGNSERTNSRKGWAFDINDNGVIVGEWYMGITMYIDPILGRLDVDLGETNDTTDTAIAGINNNNDLLAWNNGTQSIDGMFSPWVFVDGDDGSVSSAVTGTPYHLYHSDSQPYTPDIDEEGNIFLREYTGPTDLLSLLGPDSGWDSLTGRSMNIHGQIVGWGTPTGWTDCCGPWVPILMNPLDRRVPVPASILLLSLGLVGIGFSRLKKAQ